MRGYVVETTGHCMGSTLPGGTECVADPDALIEPLSLCVIVFKSNARFSGPWANAMKRHGAGIGGLTKLFVGSYDAPGIGPVIKVAEIDPPQLACIPVSVIEAMHAVVDGTFEPACDDDEAGLNVIRPHVNSGPIAPINPDWMPPMERQAA